VSRLHGRNALLYVQGSGTEAQPLSNAANYGIDIDFDTVDVSQLGDDWAQSVRGQGKFSGTFDGPFDTAITLPWDMMAVSPNSAKKFYLYPDKTSLGGYYYGTAWFTSGIKGGVQAAVTFSSKFTGTGQLTTKP
jgi:hypothetical protein